MPALPDALGLKKDAQVAIVGSGGKTSLMFRLARAFEGAIWVTHSAHLGVEQTRQADRVVMVSDELPPEELDGAGITLFTGVEDGRGRRLGLDAALLGKISTEARRRGVALLIEADGSRRKALKAPAEWEPPIPDFVEHVIVLVGMDGLGKPLSDAWVYRVEDYSRLSGLELNDVISVEAAARVLEHPQGGLKNIPAGVARSLLMNQADDAERQALAGELARRLQSTYPVVISASLYGGDARDAEIHAVYRRTAGVVLAAGEARRMGKPKQVLDWHGEALVRRAARAAIEAGLDPVVVVSGAYVAEVAQALEGLAVTLVTNPDWRSGQSSSLKAGIRALPEEAGAAIFLLADQPYVTADVIRAVVQRAQTTLAPVVAPFCGGRRGNPALFDRQTFPDLLALEGDTGGRAVMQRWTVELVPWADERILVDVDTVGEYERESKK